MSDQNETLLGFAICANISDHLRGGQDPDKYYQGTIKFSPGTKVYLGEGYWGMGCENTHVIGLRRVSRKFVNCAVEIGVLCNIRVAAVYSPKIWAALSRLHGLTFEDKDAAETYVQKVMFALKLNRPDKLKPELRSGPWGD